jgi:aspartate/methionine/tyrosine aminotransferase
MFSRRTLWATTPNRLSLRREALEHQGAPLLDLTESNPTRCGLDLFPEALSQALAPAMRAPYTPAPFGLLSAREALAADLRDQAPHAPEALVLTPSTSEAYAWLLKLLCDPGDQVLSPQPGYPLFDYLAGLEGVTTVPYTLELESGFGLALDDLRAAATDRTRAVLVVHPGNPTGAFLHRAEHGALAGLCAERGWALLVDEVFLDYRETRDPDALGSLAAEASPCLTFVLSGLSKRGGLPQLKLGWLSVHGPEPLRTEALARLEVIADTYLPVSGPVQQALPALLPIAARIRGQLQARVRENRAALRRLLPPDAPFHALPSDGGWSALLRLPRDWDEEAVCLALLDAGVAVQPGHHFDFPRGRFLVLSLLPPPATFTPAVNTLIAVLSGMGLSAR